MMVRNTYCERRNVRNALAFIKEWWYPTKTLSCNISPVPSQRSRDHFAVIIPDSRAAFMIGSKGALLREVDELFFSGCCGTGDGDGDGCELSEELVECFLCL